MVCPPIPAVGDKLSGHAAGFSAAFMAKYYPEADRSEEGAGPPLKRLQTTLDLALVEVPEALRRTILNPAKETS